MSGVASGKEDGVEPGAGGVEGVVFVEGGLAFGGVVEVEVGRCPDPVGEAVAAADVANVNVHFVSWDAHDGAGAFVFEGDVLDGVDAKEGEFADVLFILGGVPGVVGVGAMAESELVAADGVGGGGCDVCVGGESGGAGGPLEVLEEAADTVEQAVGVGADNPDDGAGAFLRDQAEGFGFHFGCGGGLSGPVAGDVLACEGDCGGVGGPFGRDRPAETGAFFGFFDEHGAGGLFDLGGFAVGDDDHGLGQIDGFFGEDRLDAEERENDPDGTATR